MPLTREEENVVAAFRGLPSDRRISRERGGRVSLGSALEVLAEKYHLGRPSPAQLLLDHWPRIVGRRFARQCAPQSISRSQALIIRCPNAIARRELLFAEDEIMTRLRSMPEFAHITRLVVRAG